MQFGEKDAARVTLDYVRLAGRVARYGQAVAIVGRFQETHARLPTGQPVRPQRFQQRMGHVPEHGGARHQRAFEPELRRDLVAVDAVLRVGGEVPRSGLVDVHLRCRLDPAIGHTYLNRCRMRKGRFRQGHGLGSGRLLKHAPGTGVRAPPVTSA